MGSLSDNAKLRQFLDGASNLLRSEARRDVFPDTNDGPTFRLQKRVGLAVPMPISDDLFSPVRRVGLRDSVVVWTPMPEASIDEHCYSKSWKDDVGGAWQRGQGSPIDIEPETSRVKQLPEFYFGLCVAPAIGNHAAPHAIRGGPGFSTLDHMFDFPGVSPSTLTESSLA